MRTSKGLTLVGVILVLAFSAQGNAAPRKAGQTTTTTGTYTVGSQTVPGVDTGVVLQNGQSVTVTATGIGTWNGKAGYSFELKATDQGEPGADRDRFKIVIRDAQGNRVASVSEKIDSGNNQSEKPPK